MKNETERHSLAWALILAGGLWAIECPIIARFGCSDPKVYDMMINYGLFGDGMAIIGIAIRFANRFRFALRTFGRLLF